MGIQGLLQFLKEASEPIHVSQYKGQTVAVDTYCWLHKGAFACADKLAKGEPTEQYVAYCMKFVHMLLAQGVRPILVFDGCTLPSKKDVERARREKRQSNLQKGKQLLREGRLSEARECFTRSVNITSDMAHRVITTARSEGIDCIVAPYEADSQLAYLNKHGFAQAIITEDSDLLAFGCKKVILKMDQYGNGLEIDQARFGKCKHLGDVFTEEKFRYMCILSGCDYLQSIHGVGLAKASKVLKIANNPDIIQVIKKMGQYLKSNITVPEGYTDGFIRANNTFLYQLVYDPVKRKLVPLNPYEDGIDPKELSYAGPNLGDSVGYQIALGNIDVNTMKKIDNYDPDHQPTKQKSHSWNNKISDSGSIWRGNFSPCTNLKSEEKPKAEEKASRRGLIIPSSKHSVKRPLEGGVSESDLLGQYSFSPNKKPKTESEDYLTKLKASPPSNILQPLEDRANTADIQPKARNKFATLLQRRNEQSGSVAATGTRSRFFCSQSDLVASPSIDVFKPTDNTTTNCSGTPDETTEIHEERTKLCVRELTPSPGSDDCGVKSNADSPLRNPRNCFSWSGSLTKGKPKSEAPSPSILTKGKPKSEAPSPSILTKGKPKSEAPSPSVLSLRRFQRTKTSMESEPENLQMDQTVNVNEDQSKCAIKSEMGSVEFEDSCSEDLDKSPESSPPEFGLEVSPVHQTAYPERKPAPKAKVSGLLKSKSFDSRSGTKLKPLAPAKASGLSSRGPTKPARNNENKPGLQATIGDLWKSFSFKKR